MNESLSLLELNVIGTCVNYDGWSRGMFTGELEGIVVNVLDRCSWNAVCVAPLKVYMPDNGVSSDNDWVAPRTRGQCGAASSRESWGTSLCPSKLGGRPTLLRSETGARGGCRCLIQSPDYDWGGKGRRRCPDESGSGRGSWDCSRSTLTWPCSWWVELVR